MAIIRTNRYNFQVPSLTEDPTPGSNLMYFQLDAHNKTTLASFMDTYFLTNTTSVTATTFGFSAPVTPGYLGGMLMLKGEVTHVRHQIYNTANDYRNNIDYAPFISMDPARPVTPVRYDYNAGLSYSMMFYNTADNTVNTVMTQMRKLGNVDFSTTPPLQNTNMTINHTQYPVYLNPITNVLVAAGGTSTTTPPAAAQGTGFTNPFGATLAHQIVGGVQGSNTSQFVGVATNGYAVFLHNGLSTDYSQLLYNYIDNSNTANLMFSVGVAPAAYGNNAGGARTAATGGNFHPKFSSRTFTNPVNGYTSWYTPYFDTAGNYHPFLFDWIKTNNTFVRNTGNVGYQGSNTLISYFMSDGTTQSAAATASGMQTIKLNETFTYSGTRYVTLMQLHGAGGIYDNNTKQLAFITYSANSLNLANLTYHSNVIIPQTPKNIVWLNDDRTSMGVVSQTATYILNFNNVTTGWNITATVPYQFNAIGRDSLGRIWAQDTGPTGFGRVHLLSGAVPTSVEVIPAANSFSYSGTPINTTFTVNAYDISGSRMVANVTLSALGGALRFYDTSNAQVASVTLTTSNTNAITANAVVISAGTVSVNSSISY